MFFFKNYAENKVRRLVPNLFIYKSLIWGESKWSAAYFQYILIALILPYNRTKLYKALDYWSRDMLDFSFSERGLGLVSSPHFVYDFFRKMFMLHSINWPNFIVRLSLLLKIGQYVYYNCLLTRLWRHKLCHKMCTDLSLPR